MKHHALPLDFSLLNSNDEAVLFLDGPQDMVLRLYNNAPVPLVLNHLTAEHHFTLRFRSGALRDHKGIRLDDAGHKHWHLDTRDEKNGDVVLELRRKAEADMTWAAGDTVHLMLDGLRGKMADGTRATRIELTYDHIRLQGEDTNLFAAKPRHHQLVLMPAMLRGALGAQDVPLLEAHFVGDTGNVVLNDGGSYVGAIVLRLTNTTVEALLIGHEAALYLTLPDGLENLPGALASKASLQACSVTAHLREDVADESTIPLECQPALDDRVAWKIHLPEHTARDLWLHPAGGLEIMIEGLATRHRNGPSRLHVRWVNLGSPGKQSVGELVATLQKSPMVVKGQRVGIGTVRPRAALDVRGDLHIDGRVTAPGPLDVDATLKANKGIVLGGVTLTASTLRDTKTVATVAKRYTADEFEAFDGWPTSLASLDSLTFTFPFPAQTKSYLASGSVSVRVTAASEAPQASHCPVAFTSLPIPVTVTVSGDTLTAAADTGSAVPVTDIPVQEGMKSLEISTSIFPGATEDLTQVRSRLAQMSVEAGDWAHSFGRDGPNVRWMIEATCSVSVLFLGDSGDLS
ncbi:hypothetical protein [Falsiroseomonas sp. E2-1-a4]|uniref:hypothetical protein n=1 Tax=Falsiroseomonas sp. E2-1-a4 TaxID=3239299 RepID=UPI003F353010